MVVTKCNLPLQRPSTSSFWRAGVSSLKEKQSLAIWTDGGGRSLSLLTVIVIIVTPSFSLIWATTRQRSSWLLGRRRKLKRRLPETCSLLKKLHTKVARVCIPFPFEAIFPTRKILRLFWFRKCLAKCINDMIGFNRQISPSFEQSLDTQATYF